MPYDQEASRLRAVAILFYQDVEALGLQQHYIERDSRKGVVENNRRADVAAVRLRRMLHGLAAAEQK